MNRIYSAPSHKKHCLNNQYFGQKTTVFFAQPIFTLTALASLVLTSTNAFAVTDRGFFYCVTPSDNVAALMGATASELSSFCGSNYKENILSFLNASEGKTAMGYGAWVEGQNATALGTKAKAYEEGDLAIGVYATATGKDSSADVSTRNKMIDAIKRTETYGPNGTRSSSHRHRA